MSLTQEDIEAFAQRPLSAHAADVSALCAKIAELQAELALARSAADVNLKTSQQLRAELMIARH